MAYKIIETDSFTKSLNETFDYILDNFKNKKIIDDMLVIIDYVCNLLKEFPNIFSDFKPAYKLELSIKRFPVKKYFVYYHVDEIKHEVQLIKIIHSSRNTDNENYLL